ncbi:SLC13 family permease [Phascolarctobacterium sp.]|uniref:SLC13 family permease n=1 Tax=Phascolarctobacterium sp. TaxID=2049039 RepID=UPI003F7D46B0
MALLSLLFLLLAIFLGFVRKMNTGLLCIAFALVLGRMSGVSDAVIMKGFNSSLFIMLLGVTYLFSMAQINGSLDLLAQKVIALAGSRVYLIPVIIYVFSIVLAALGPGSVPTMAIMMVFSMSLAAEMKISPVLLSTLTVLGSCAGGLSPLAATGIIGANLCAEFGLTGIENDFLLNGVFSFTVYAVLVYVWLGGVNELELASSITTISHVAAISPLSTGGALALAAYASAANANQKQQQNLFMKMFGVSALGVSVLCVFSYFGMFHWLL